MASNIAKMLIKVKEGFITKNPMSPKNIFKQVPNLVPPNPLPNAAPMIKKFSKLKTKLKG